MIKECVFKKVSTLNIWNNSVFIHKTEQGKQANKSDTQKRETCSKWYHGENIDYTI